MNNWAKCHRNDKYKVLRKDEINNLYFISGKNSLTIVKNVQFKRFSEHETFKIDNVKGDEIQDYRPFHYYSMVIFASKNGFLSIYNWKGELITYFVQKIDFSEMVTTVNICKHNAFIMVATCNGNFHSPKLFLYELKEMRIIEHIDSLDMDELPDRLSKEKSSYIYDVNMDFYLYNMPIFVAVQCHFERRMFVFTVHEKKLILLKQKDGNYSNVRIVESNKLDSVAVVGSNQCVTILKFLVQNMDDLYYQ